MAYKESITELELPFTAFRSRKSELKRLILEYLRQEFGFEGEIKAKILNDDYILVKLSYPVEYPSRYLLEQKIQMYLLDRLVVK